MSDELMRSLQAASGSQTGEELSPRKPGSAPVWEGPGGLGKNGGITFSLLSRFLVCRERFRLLVVDGLKVKDAFNHRLEFGNMWHVCEEAIASEVRHFGEEVGTTLWEDDLLSYWQELAKKYPYDQEAVAKWYEVTRLQFPLYREYWRKHPEMLCREPLFSEHSFRVPYKLPSGRIVQLRGKWDSVDKITDGKLVSIWLQENKTKGDIRPLLMQRQLKYDLQTMLYLTALCEEAYPLYQQTKGGIRGVRYNVIRRPLSGGKGTIIQHKPSKSNPGGETKESYYRRLAQYIKDEPDHYFMRWNVEVSAEDVERFKVRTLNPILEQLCDWWDWIHTLGQDPFDTYGSGGIHWQHPFGVWNILNEGGASDLDTYIENGNEMSLEHSTNLFPELD